MKRWLIGLMLLIGPPALAQQAVPQGTSVQKVVVGLP